MKRQAEGEKNLAGENGDESFAYLHWKRMSRAAGRLAGSFQRGVGSFNPQSSPLQIGRNVFSRLLSN